MRRKSVRSSRLTFVRWPETWRCVRTCRCRRCISSPRMRPLPSRPAATPERDSGRDAGPSGDAEPAGSRRAALRRNAARSGQRPAQDRGVNARRKKGFGVATSRLAVNRGLMVCPSNPPLRGETAPVLSPCCRSHPHSSFCWPASDVDSGARPAPGRGLGPNARCDFAPPAVLAPPPSHPVNSVLATEQ